MSNDEAEAIQAYYEQRDVAQNRQTFLRRMEHKMNHRMRSGRE